MKALIARLNWHNAFGQILKRVWNHLDLQILTEVEVAKNPLRIDMVIIRSPQQLPPEQLQQLPDGLREQLKPHNIVDFKSIHESYGLRELQKTLAYSCLYEEQNGIAPNDLSVFAVASMTPRKLLTHYRDWIEMITRGVYRADVRFRSIWILVPNELPLHETNDVLGFFASHRDRYVKAIEHWWDRSRQKGWEGLLRFLAYRLKKEMQMAGLTLDELYKEDYDSAKFFLSHMAPKKKQKLLEEELRDMETQQKQQLLERELEALDDEQFEQLLAKRKARGSTSL